AQDFQHGVAWSLDAAVLGDGTPVTVYTEVREDLDPDYVVLSSILAIPDDFEAEFIEAQNGILIDGDPIFMDVDVNDLEDLIVGGAPATGEPAATPADATPVAGEPRDHAKLPDNGSGGRNESETGAATRTSDSRDGGSDF